MVLIGLLLVALLCIVLGMVFASGPWFIGSLVASGLAAFLLWRQREDISRRGGSTNDPAPTPPRQTALVTGTAFAGKTGSADAPAAASLPASGGGSGGAQAVTSSPAAAASASQARVWVVDGRPQFHRQPCALLTGLPSEPVPYAQAVEDGFVECDTCGPVLAPQDTQVWVVDGRPEYHRAGCTRVSGAEAEAIPSAQAVADGFIPCASCRPEDDGVAVGVAPAPPTSAANGVVQHPSPDPEDVAP